MISRFLVLCGTLLLSACSTIVDGVEKVADDVQEREDRNQRQVTVSTDSRSPIPDDPFYAPIEPSPAADPVIVTGSMFNSNTSRSLYSYTPPFALGDTITVMLEEEATATKSASSNLAKENSYKLDPVTVPGGSLTINGKVVELEMSQKQDFDGTSDANQRHRLSGRITVSVVDILNNGNLVVRGEKWLVINNGKEYMRFTGIVRPLDVGENNSIGSYQVADARIEFSGTGDHADVQTQGWLSSFLGGSMWPL
ncbi:MULTISPECIES: flagellar basal body L-ring protein FlgH [unclassified Agarivorans]|uniref:flagellar basal body L-ring protein FlgH n=1 Tax=unclassified Agarivorans TaxID=2636026 RepID=UPI0010DEBEBE|nr:MULTISPECIES: flagellar basal body L-ring protein FlgH [unclassified Agarivorans]MDO6687823.1 flagellar basal body L-ring protein FlgH [Agarivorans sp. 3_MG-2023]MDO6717445.1 flagellar basal body L-ring protein FlgH [Agarivorans sp. 2_MG-2023]MDO6763169.1 flagellar basal body L-ring protein FlgH [Agarivorans sp. 1_MG-2023]GDY27046.1 flagellar L-ring protein [Agarivorans sp. Toyoura001]